MSKYHVNNQGEPGKCRATADGKCPFGSADEHHDSPESARVAFEKSNVGKELPVPMKKMSRRERKELASELNEAYNNYDPKKYDGLKFSNVVFDQLAVEDDCRSYVKRNFPKLSKSDTEDAVSARLERKKQDWETLTRMKPAEAFEKIVPIRLAPVGSEVLSDDGRVIGTVAEPEARHDLGDYVSAVRRNDGTTHDYEGHQTINVGKIPSDAPARIDAVWERLDKFAGMLQVNRAKYERATKNGRALDNLEKML